MTDMRVALRPIRFELIVVAILGLAAIALAFGIMIRLDAFAVPDACLRSADLTSPCSSPAELEAYNRFSGTWIPLALLVICLAPSGAGLLAGVSLVGKELESRTTFFAWSMSPSRHRWLALRLLPLAVLLVTLGLIAGLLGDRLVALNSPTIDAARNLAPLGFVGMVPAAQALAVLGISVLVGTAAGRVMPALLFSAALAGGAYAGVNMANQAALAGETIIVGSGYTIGGGLSREVLVRNPQGELISYDEALARFSFEEFEKLSRLERINPGEIAGPVTARLALLFGTIGLLCITIGFAVIARRRP